MVLNPQLIDEQVECETHEKREQITTNIKNINIGQSMRVAVSTVSGRCFCAKSLCYLISIAFLLFLESNFHSSLHRRARPRDMEATKLYSNQSRSSISLPSLHRSSIAYNPILAPFFFILRIQKCLIFSLTPTKSFAAPQIMTSQTYYL